MNILILSPFLPYPLDQGGKIRIFNLIKHLSRTHSVTLAAVVDNLQAAQPGPLGEICAEVRLFERPARLWADRFAFFGGSAPYNVIRYRSSQMRHALEHLHREKKFDLVQVEFSMMWQYADLFPSVPVVLDAHNIEYKNVQQIGERASSLLWQVLYRVEKQRLQAVEERAWRECAACFAVSEKERVEIAGTLGDKGAKVVTAANGVDPERFPFRPRSSGGKRILLLGGMDYAPNLDATGYFLTEVFPKIRAQEPDARVLLVGRELGRLGELATSPAVECHENVADVVPWFYEADLLAVPLRQGAGTRIKVLEAMAAGLPVVTTSKGCEGIAVHGGREMLIADSADAFAVAAIRVLQDPRVGLKLAQAARELVTQRYSWESAVHSMDRAFRELVNSSPKDVRRQ